MEDKATGTRYARCGELEDVGDVGDEYNYSPPATDRRITSADARDVRVTQVLTGHAIAPSGSTHAGVTGRGGRRSAGARPKKPPTRQSPSSCRSIATPQSVTWAIAIENRSMDHRLRVLFPIGVGEVTHVRAETAFGVATRARGAKRRRRAAGKCR